ncbi:MULTISPECIES: SDR family oxidoreductase [Kaistia]|uniref:NADP-dependent 3-hydroxy acid dehydrogenase YdfG n=1 Tax=Kaistia defluvii TaxID=410841 RepID=A0ABV2R7H1_9HYPH
MSNQGTALVTGASSGIGAVYADRLARRGFDLTLVARNTDRLEVAAKRITNETGRLVRVVTADLTDAASLHRVEGLIRSDPALTLLVNNAGFGAVAPLMESDIDRMERMVDLNVTALMRLTNAAVPGFVGRGKGAIINISSIAAVAPEILNGVYGGTKAFVLAFSQSLQHELGAKGIRVQAVLPGGTATEFWDIAGNGDYGRSARAMSPEQMVDAALVGFDRGELVTIPSLQDGALWDEFQSQRRRLAADFAHSKPGARYIASA